MMTAEEEVKHLRELVSAQNQLLVAYRLQDHKKADKALTRIDKARAALTRD